MRLVYARQSCRACTAEHWSVMPVCGNWLTAQCPYCDAMACEVMLDRGAYPIDPQSPYAVAWAMDFPEYYVPCTSRPHAVSARMGRC